MAAPFIRRGEHLVRLVDDSHFGISLLRCTTPACRHYYITFFCECVDWADGDDPQAWVAAPISRLEFAALSSLPTPTDETAILQTLATPRRFIVRSMPKGAPETIQWRAGVVFIPAHD